MTVADGAIRWSTAAAVIDVAVVATAVSYEHAFALVHAHGKKGWTARLIRLTVDGFVWAGSTVSSTQRAWRASADARAVASRPGMATTLAVNVAHGLGHGPIGAADAWPAVALAGSCELL